MKIPLATPSPKNPLNGSPPPLTDPLKCLPLDVPKESTHPHWHLILSSSSFLLAPSSTARFSLAKEREKEQSPTSSYEARQLVLYEKCLKGLNVDCWELWKKIICSLLSRRHSITLLTLSLILTLIKNLEWRFSRHLFRPLYVHKIHREHMIKYNTIQQQALAKSILVQKHSTLPCCQCLLLTI